jgi:hypothetical protein
MLAATKNDWVQITLLIKNGAKVGAGWYLGILGTEAYRKLPAQ